MPNQHVEVLSLAIQSSGFVSCLHAEDESDAFSVRAIFTFAQYENTKCSEGFSMQFNKKFCITSLIVAIATTVCAGSLALHYAAQESDPTQKSIESEVVLNAFGMTAPEPKAATYFDEPRVLLLCKYIEVYDIEGVEKVLSHGVDVNWRGKYGLTPLTWALQHRCWNLIPTLLEHGADPDARVTKEIMLYRLQMRKGDSFLIASARNQQFDLFSTAIPYSSNINQKDDDGYGILPIYIVCSFLLKDGPPPGRHTQMLDKLIKNGVDINAKHKNGQTALHLALHNHRNFVTLLLNRGADPFIEDDEGLTPLDHYFSMARTRLDLRIYHEIYEILQKLGHVDANLTFEDAIQKRYPEWEPQTGNGHTRRLEQNRRQ